MDQMQLGPVADILIQSYWDTATYSRAFIEDYGQPPTQAAKGHHLRSIAQARILQDDRFELGALFAESGRIEITDRATGLRYLLRSETTVAIERGKARQRESLFDAATYLNSDALMLVHRFRKEGLDLSLAGTRYEVGRSRLEVTGVPSFVATWPYLAAEQFDQDEEDPFGDVGEISEADEGKSG